MTITFILLAITIALFIWDKIRSDLVAIMALLLLYLLGILSTQQALSGFSDTTVIMIAALFIVGEGLSRSGVTAWVSQQILALAGDSPRRLLVMVMLGAALLSAFISNTGTVATLLPAVIAIAWSVKSVPSKYLIPLAFAANAGGLLTLTGTPPNIIVAEVLSGGGFQPFSFFEFALIGVPLLVITIGYMVVMGQRSLPQRETDEQPIDLDASMQAMADSFALQGKLYRLRVNIGSSLAGKTLAEAALGHDFNVSVLRIEQSAERTRPYLSPAEVTRRQVQRTVEHLQTHQEIPTADTQLQVNDVLLVKGTPEAVQAAVEQHNLSLEEIDVYENELADVLVSHDIGVAEVLITPRSAYIGQSLQDGRFTQKYGVQVISIRRENKLVSRQGTRLNFGDALLVRGRWENIELLRNESRNFVVVGQPEAMSRQIIELNRQSVIATLALVAMVGMMVSGLVPTVMAALITAVIMILGGCLTPTQAYRTINWQSVVLIAAMIPMSTALQITGGADLVANLLVSTLGSWGNLALLVGIFVLTTGFSQVISNTATAVLVAPIVLGTASALGVSPYPLMMTVAIGASTAFLTPIASTTNLMVMSPGGYTFKDFVKNGLPLVLLFLLTTLLLVPIIWPF
ncbi:MAG: SLC13 family permease [Chloroflexi bacterium]|nr:SLC13 family permease [Chloroflexota bacterium]MBK6713327.1 SLC13 family permease [Chloroflexota bacterium]MBP6804213.1 SLC13 family permease [Chloroflexota bacterium]MBP7591010.1 SLC13 family permease [Chloroflexota bacterium]